MCATTRHVWTPSSSASCHDNDPNRPNPNPLIESTSLLLLFPAPVLRNMFSLLSVAQSRHSPAMMMERHSAPRPITNRVIARLTPGWLASTSSGLVHHIPSSPAPFFFSLCVACCLDYWSISFTHRFSLFFLSKSKRKREREYKININKWKQKEHLVSKCGQPLDVARCFLGSRNLSYFFQQYVR